MFERQDLVVSSRRSSVGLPLVLLAWFGLVGPAPPTWAFEQAGGAEKAQTTDPWEPFRLLEGHWEGAIDGRLGQGTGGRHLTFILDDKFLLLRHASVRLPQEKSPRGDYHRELSIFSFDRERGKVVYRQFLVEGFVIRYTCDVESKRFVCTSESVENGPGMRARLTVEISDRYRFDEIFELASPGKELEVYFTNRWTRVPNLDD